MDQCSGSLTYFKKNIFSMVFFTQISSFKINENLIIIFYLFLKKIYNLIIEQKIKREDKQQEILLGFIIKTFVPWQRNMIKVFPFLFNKLYFVGEKYYYFFQHFSIKLFEILISIQLENSCWLRVFGIDFYLKGSHDGVFVRGLDWRL
jgi:hypothetical protein